MAYCTECDYEIQGGERECPDCGDPLIEVRTESDEEVEVIRDDNDRIELQPLNEDTTDTSEKSTSSSYLESSWSRAVSMLLNGLGVSLIIGFLTLGLWFTNPSLMYFEGFLYAILIVGGVIAAFTLAIVYSGKKRMYLERIGFYVSAGLLTSSFYLYAAAHWIGPIFSDGFTDTNPGDGQQQTQAPQDGAGEQEEQSSDPEQTEQGDMSFENAMGEAQSKIDASMQNLEEMSSGGGGEGVSQATSLGGDATSLIQTINDPAIAFLVASALTALTVAFYFKRVKSADQED